MTQQDDVQALIAPYHEKIVKCIYDSIEAWKQMLLRSPEQALALTSRTRANFMSDNITRNATIAFDGMQGVRLATQRGFLIVVIDEQIPFRFKKLNKYGRTSNVMTRQQREMYEKQIPLPDMPLGLRITIGYQLDSSESEISSIKVVYERNGELLWSYDIVVNQVSPQIITQFTLPEAVPNRAKRVKPKTASFGDVSESEA